MVDRVAVSDDRPVRLPAAKAAYRAVKRGKTLCPRGDLPSYDTGCDLANRYLIVVRAGVDSL